MEKINIAEILADCPKGTKLYSPIFGEVYLDKIRPHLAIIVTTDKYKEEFLYDGRYGMNGECMLFPSKDQRDWSKFQRPFKDGDILISGLGGCDDNPFIFKQTNRFSNAECYCAINCRGKLILNNDNWTPIKGCRFATEEEKQKLFDAIKSNGYKWNAETKTLEKLVKPKFKVGDRIKAKDDYKKFITGDHVSTITSIKDGKYWSGIFAIEYINEQDKWELDKFDITTLKPFESKVLVRDNVDEIWFPCFFGCLSNNNDDYPYMVIGCESWKYCIPYEGNEHLLNTNKDCDEYYKNW